jgi:hypothetical protein
VNGDVYVDECIDGSELIPIMNAKYGAWGWTLMQDGAPAHTKGSTMDYLTTYCNVLANWPSGSPDLNPIENLWAIIKRRISEIGATTIEELERIINDVWYSLPADLLENLVASMPARLQATLDADGGHNGY